MILMTNSIIFNLDDFRRTESNLVSRRGNVVLFFTEKYGRYAKKLIETILRERIENIERIIAETYIKISDARRQGVLFHKRKILNDKIFWMEQRKILYQEQLKNIKPTPFENWVTEYDLFYVEKNGFKKLLNMFLEIAYEQ